jgi:thioredoxin reductase
MFTIKKEFRMTKQEIENYNALPDNLPDNKLTAKQVDQVNALYYKYITKTIDRKDWSKEMFEVEKREAWPSGPRMKAHEAKRIVLNNLIEQQGRKLTDKKAAIRFHSALTCRPMYAKLLHEIYEQV